MINTMWIAVVFTCGHPLDAHALRFFRDGEDAKAADISAKELAKNSDNANHKERQEILARTFKDRNAIRVLLLARQFAKSETNRMAIDSAVNDLIYPKVDPKDPFQSATFKNAVAKHSWAVATHMAAKNPQMFDAGSTKGGTDADSRNACQAELKQLWTAAGKLNPDLPARFPRVQHDAWIRDALYRGPIVNRTTVVQQLEVVAGMGKSLVLCERIERTDLTFGDSLVVCAGDIECGNITDSIVIVSGSLKSTGGIRKSLVITTGDISAAAGIGKSVVGTLGTVQIKADQIEASKVLDSSELTKFFASPSSVVLRSKYSIRESRAVVTQSLDKGEESLLRDDVILAINGHATGSISDVERACGKAIAWCRTYVTVRRGEQTLVLLLKHS